MKNLKKYWYIVAIVVVIAVFVIYDYKHKLVFFKDKTTPDSQILSIGSVGTEVKRLQTVLNTKIAAEVLNRLTLPKDTATLIPLTVTPAALVIDGIFGIKTKAALSYFLHTESIKTTDF